MMCEKCDAIDRQIMHLLDIAKRVLDQQMLDGIDNLIAELDAKKAPLHPD
jgi:hypothetical protein